jgi:two-component system NarL family response regulator
MSTKSIPKRPRSTLASPADAPPRGTPQSSAPGAKIRILIADDHMVVREGLAAVLHQQPDMVVVAQGQNGREALDLWKQHQPDVTLVDMRMPELDGVGAIEKIRAFDAAARVIILTTFDGDEDIFRAMRAGAKAYLLKSVHREELLECIRRIHAGALYVPPDVAAKLAEHVCGETLTRREKEVLELLSKGQSNKEIGANLFISETTVKTHIKGIFVKLHVSSRTEAIATAGRRGFIRL